MPKIERSEGVRKIGLDQIIVTDNVRSDYADIEELAASIKKFGGLLEPVIVKVAEPDSEGNPRFELIAGHRRKLAYDLLREEGEGYTAIEAVVKTGDSLTIQLVENLQRTDLSAKERERGIFKMVENGLSQKEVAAELSKTEPYISRHVTAWKIREIAEAQGIDTSPLETAAISEIQTVKEKDIPMIIKYVINGGGTKAAAREIMKNYRGNLPKPEQAEPGGDAPADEVPGPDPDVTLDTEGQESPPWNPGSIPPCPEQISAAPEPEPEPEEEREPEPPPEKAAPRHTPPIPRDAVDPEHRVIDLQDVFDKIYSYLSALEKKINELGPGAEEAVIAEYKRDATYDIIAVLHEGI